MREFLAIITWFAGGLVITAVLATGLEQRQMARSHVDENADVRPGIVAITASGYAVAPSTMPIQLGFRPGSVANEI